MHNTLIQLTSYSWELTAAWELLAQETYALKLLAKTHVVALNIQKRRNQNFKVVAPAYLFCAACVWHESSMAALLQPQLSTGRRGAERGKNFWAVPGVRGGGALGCSWKFCSLLSQSLLGLPPAPEQHRSSACLAAARRVFLLSRSQRGEGKGRGGGRPLVFSAELLHKFQRRHEDRNLLK